MCSARGLQRCFVLFWFLLCFVLCCFCLFVWLVFRLLEINSQLLSKSLLSSFSKSSNTCLAPEANGWTPEDHDWDTWLITVVILSPLRVVGPPCKWPNFMAYKWGERLLTTYKSWDDPPSRGPSFRVTGHLPDVLTT